MFTISTQWKWTMQSRYTISMKRGCDNLTVCDSGLRAVWRPVETYYAGFKFFPVKRLYKFGGLLVLLLNCSSTLFFLYKNVVFPAQAEYSYFSADFRLKIFLYYS